MEPFKSIFTINIAGYKLGITSSVITQWVIILLVLILSLILTRNLKRIPGKRQTVLEGIVNGIKNVVIENMGKENAFYGSFFLSLAMFIALMNLTPLIGFRAPTEDYSVPAGLAIFMIIVMQVGAVRKNGFGNYIKGYGKPVVVMVPMNIIEKFTLPLSLSLRLFGNMVSGGVIMGLIYSALGKVSWVAQIGVPIIGHAYFDIFDGLIQTLIFTMLSMVNMKILLDH